mmetsp:Transcript_18452/g.44424  ORF Transcript_18452/g.44424 Transcript_18452/m.44424 type:complete len:202 (-) Transcript_18452:885-1490(-)
MLPLLQVLALLCNDLPCYLAIAVTLLPGGSQIQDIRCIAFIFVLCVLVFCESTCPFVTSLPLLASQRSTMFLSMDDSTPHVCVNALVFGLFRLAFGCDSGHWGTLIVSVRSLTPYVIRSPWYFRASPRQRDKISSILLVLGPPLHHQWRAVISGRAPVRGEGHRTVLVVPGSRLFSATFPPFLRGLRQRSTARGPRARRFP